MEVKCFLCHRVLSSGRSQSKLFGGWLKGEEREETRSFASPGNSWVEGADVEEENIYPVSRSVFGH